MYNDGFDLTFFLALYVPYIIFAIVAYVLCSISFFKVAKRRGIRLYGLAWVPVASAWVMGSIADIHDRQRGVEHKWRQVLLWLSIIIFFCMLAFMFLSFWLAYNIPGSMSDLADLGIVLIMILAMLAFCLCVTAAGACNCICLYKFYESCRPRSTISFLLLSLILPITLPFFVFACRDWDNDVKYTGCKPELTYIPQQSQTTEE